MSKTIVQLVDDNLCGQLLRKMHPAARNKREKKIFMPKPQKSWSSKVNQLE